MATLIWLPAWAQDAAGEAPPATVKPNPLGVLDTSKFNDKMSISPTPELLKGPLPDAAVSAPSSPATATEPQPPASQAGPDPAGPDAASPGLPTGSVTEPSAAPTPDTAPLAVTPTPTVPTATAPAATAPAATAPTTPAAMVPPATAPTGSAPAASPPAATSSPPQPSSRTVSKDHDKAWAPVQQPIDTIDAQRFRQKARAAIAMGDIAAARALLDGLAARHDPEASFLMAQTFDPQKLSEWGVVGVEGDADRAFRYYRRASEGGYPAPGNGSFR